MKYLMILVTVFGLTTAHAMKQETKEALVALRDTQRKAQEQAHQKEQHAINELFDAIEKDNIVAIDKILTEHPTLVNAQKDGETPYMQAIKTENVAILRKLQDKGAKIDIIADNGKTALTFAVSQGKKPSLISLLQVMGASPLQKDKSGKNMFDYQKEAKLKKDLAEFTIIGDENDLDISDWEKI